MPASTKGIIPAADFAKVQALHEQSGRSGGRSVRNKHGALLRGIQRRKVCDCSMERTNRDRKQLFRALGILRVMLRMWITAAAYNSAKVHDLPTCRVIPSIKTEAQRTADCLCWIYRRGQSRAASNDADDTCDSNRPAKNTGAVTDRHAHKSQLQSHPTSTQRSDVATSEDLFRKLARAYPDKTPDTVLSYYARVSVYAVRQWLLRGIACNHIQLVANLVDEDIETVLKSISFSSNQSQALLAPRLHPS